MLEEHLFKEESGVIYKNQNQKRREEVRSKRGKVLHT